VLREPVGVVAAITPFNFPLSLNLVKLGPALAVGNTAILKPAPLTPLEGLVLGAAAAEADLPPGVLNVVTGERQVGEALVADGRVDMVSFTGSDATGRAVMALAAGTLKRLVLELGGKSALIVRADADVAAAAENGFRSFTTHAGQGCSLLTRHVVHRAVVDEFADHLRERAMATVVGDPLDPATTMGPLISAPQRARVADLVEVGATEGGTVAVGGRALQRPGYYYEPTVITGVAEDMRVAQEEIFGPVAVVIPFDTDEEAVQIANNSRFGLSGAIYSRDVGTAYEMALRLRTGQVRINGGGTAPDLDAPIMGRKSSGMGAEPGWPDSWNSLR
jgi:acyl-CoA reductase-like NAD-dependent aldehyde dehydrogenase